MPDRAKLGALDSNVSAALHTAKDASFIFYPAYCYDASPTWFTWVKLTAHQIHNHLTIQHGYHAALPYANTGTTWPQNQPLLLFYLNHPVQFVQLVGVVVAFETFFDKFWLFVLDDSSGATIEVNCRKPEKPEKPDANADNLITHNGKEQKKDMEAEARYTAMAKLDIGDVVQAKGQITTFRNVRQLQLERISFVSDTNQEMRLVAARTNLYETTLKHPWEVSPSKQKYLRDRALGETNAKDEHALRRRKRAQLSVEREKRHAQKVAQRYEQEEKQRQEYAEKVRKTGRLLET